MEFVKQFQSKWEKIWLQKLLPVKPLLEKEGVKLYLNGVPSTTEYIVNNCVNEDTVYMPDYVTDGRGRIKEIRYDRISIQ